MKASVSPAVGLCAAFCLLGLATLCAQDAVVLKDGSIREGRILGTRSNAVRLSAGPAEASIPLEIVSAVRMVPPKNYPDALALWQKGETVGALALLKPLAGTFSGLPVSWARRTAWLLGAAFLANGQESEAEEAFRRFQQLYPDSAALADAGFAAIEVSRGQMDRARARLEPLVEKVRGTLLPSPEDSDTLGLALFLMGQIQESAGDAPAALQNYLLASALFPGDKALVRRCRENAAELQKKNVSVP